MTLGAALGGLPAVLRLRGLRLRRRCAARRSASPPPPCRAPGCGRAQDYRLVVLGLDPRDGPDKALACAASLAGGGQRPRRHRRFLVAGPPGVAAATRPSATPSPGAATGFDHPLALLVLRRRWPAFRDPARPRRGTGGGAGGAAGGGAGCGARASAQPRAAVLRRRRLGTRRGTGGRTDRRRGGDARPARRRHPAAAAAGARAHEPDARSGR